MRWFFYFCQNLNLMGFRLIIFFALCLFFSCQNDSNRDNNSIPENPSIHDQLLGTWEVKLLKIEVDTYQGTDSSFVFEVSEEYWEEIYKVKPFRTFFAQDSTFRTTRKNLQGLPMGEDRGLWRAFGDTLMLLQPNATLQYKVSISKGQAIWAGLVDWDMDGVEDDVYYGEYRYVGRSSNE